LKSVYTAVINKSDQLPTLIELRRKIKLLSVRIKLLEATQEV
jgi:hypothetical protein